MDQTAVRNVARIRPICSQCGKFPAEPRYKRCIFCRSRNTGQQYQRKKKVLQWLGSECRCCGQRIFDFLDIDHIYNDGKADREKGRTGTSLHSNILKFEYGDNLRARQRFQILCTNCNASKGRFGICVHESLRRDIQERIEEYKREGIPAEKWSDNIDDFARVWLEENYAVYDELKRNQKRGKDIDPEIPYVREYPLYPGEE